MVSDTHRYPASAVVQRVFLGSAPAYVCVGCRLPFLRPNADAELWRRAVRCGVISDAESVDFYQNTPTRRCYSSEEDRDANGAALRACLDCFNATERTASTKRFGHNCRSLQHSQVSTDKPATARPGPACLLYLWGINEAEGQRRLSPIERKKVCSACKSLAERFSRNAAPFPTPPHGPPRVASVSAPPVIGEAAAAFSSTPLPAAGATPLAISAVIAFSIKPDSDTVPELFSAFLRRTGGTELAERFPNGVTRVYRRVVTTRKSVVRPRQERRRWAMAVASVRRLFPSIDADALASTMRVVCGVARATGGVAVAPYHRPSERQQVEFKVANRISGVTWTRVRVFLGGAASGLASREVLRRASDLAAAEDRNRVTTTADAAFLVSPRGAVQALLDDIVSSQNFLECPVSDGVSSTPARDCASG